MTDAMLDQTRITIAELLALPALLIFAIGFNASINSCFGDLLMEFDIRSGDLGIHDLVPDWLFERMIDVSDRPIDYALIGAVAFAFSFMRRPVRYAGLILLVTLPVSCFYSDTANQHLDRWLELPFAVVMVSLYVYRCRWGPWFSSRKLAWTTLSNFGAIGLAGFYMLQ